MSGISAVGGVQSDYYALWLQQLSRSSSVDSGTTTTATDAGDAVTASDGTATSGSADSLLEQVLAAMLTAVQNTQDSGDSTDLFQSLKDAVEKTLKDNGIDVQQLAQGPQGPPPGPPPGVSESGSDSDTNQNDLVSLLEASGLSDSQANDVNQQVESAVASALETAQQSGDTTDFRQIIRNAVDTTLQSNGIDPQTVTPHAHHGHHVHGAGGMMPGGDDTSASSTDSTTSDSTDSTSDTSTSVQNQLLTLLEQLLKSFGDSGSGNNQLLGLVIDTQS